jgi:hypothetical protein
MSIVCLSPTALAVWRRGYTWVPAAWVTVAGTVALKARAELYHSVLQVHVQDLEKTLGELAVSVENLLNQKAAA